MLSRHRNTKKDSKKRRDEIEREQRGTEAGQNQEKKRTNEEAPGTSGRGRGRRESKNIRVEDEINKRHARASYLLFIHEALG